VFLLGRARPGASTRLIGSRVDVPFHR
jgi:hypothetical protein